MPNPMGFLDRFRKKTASAKKPAAARAKASAAPASKEPRVVTTSPHAELSLRLLRRPHVSEKAARLADRGTYVFDVSMDAEKIAIRKAVEALYQVKVSGVRTIRHEGKFVRRGRQMGQRVRWKKALVTLAPGQKIELFEGV